MSYTIGICGGSASGKTAFVKAIREKLPEKDVCLFSMDNYYKTIDLQPLDLAGVANFDSPDSIDLALLLKDLRRLKSGETIQGIEYVYNSPGKSGKEYLIKSAPVILVEGIFVLVFEELLQELDLKIFIEAQDHIRIKRRIQRDWEERGYTMEDVFYRYEHHVVPTYERYISPTRHSADLIIPNNVTFENALTVLTTFIHSRII